MSRCISHLVWSVLSGRKGIGFLRSKGGGVDCPEIKYRRTPVLITDHSPRTKHRIGTDDCRCSKQRIERGKVPGQCPESAGPQNVTQTTSVLSNWSRASFCQGEWSVKWTKVLAGITGRLAVSPVSRLTGFL